MSPKVSIELINLGCEQVVSGGADLISYTPGTVQVIAEEYLAAGMATDLEGGAPHERTRSVIRSSTARANTSAPRMMSSSLVFSEMWWLRPPMLGTNSIAAGR